MLANTAVLPPGGLLSQYQQLKGYSIPAKAVALTNTVARSYQVHSR